MSGQQRIAILGGGVTGLAAAYRLYELLPGADVALFESSNRLGGVVRSEHVEGFCLEQGPDSLLTQVPWGLDLCQRVGLAGEMQGTASQPHGVYVVCRGRLRRVPDGLALMAPQRLWPLIVSPILSVRGKLRLAREYFISRREETSDESLAAFAKRRLGREAFERLVQPLVSGIFMGSPDKLSVRATFPRFVEMEERYGGLIKAARAQARMDRAKGAEDRGRGKSENTKRGGPAYGMFVAPRQGMEQITRAIADCLPSDSIQMRTVVEEMHPSDHGRWKLVTRSPKSEHAVQTFDAVVLAAPAHAAARLLYGAAPSLAAELAGIDYASCVVVNLAFASDQIHHPLAAFGFVTPLIERRQITACTFSSIKYPGRAPEGWCLLRAYLGGAANPSVVDWPDHEIEQAALQDLKELLAVRGVPRFMTVQRHRRAMPQYELGHLARVDRIEQLARSMSGFALAGNAYRGGGVAHCIHSGETAAEQIASQLREQPLPQMAQSGA